MVKYPLNLTENQALTFIGLGCVLIAHGLNNLYGNHDNHTLLMIGGVILSTYAQSVFR